MCRSITGASNRETLEILSEIAPICIREIRTGTPVFDWSVPPEWHIKSGHIVGAQGNILVDFADHNLHVASFSEPVRGEFSWTELLPHLYRHPTEAKAIPYRTTYYKRDWGFCVNECQFQAIFDDGGPYFVEIESTFVDGVMVYGDLLLPGTSSREILVSTYFCHPSLANDNLSGLILTAFLARELGANVERKWTYRFVFVPETIGAIAYCALNESAIRSIDMGFVITTVGGPGPLAMKASWQQGHTISRISEKVIRQRDPLAILYPFDIHGSDERQYSSPAFRINMVTIGRDLYYRYKQYHSSLDDLTLVTGESIASTLSAYLEVIQEIESLRIFARLEDRGEIMLSKHDLYYSGGGAFRPDAEDLLGVDEVLLLLFHCDGRKPIQDIAALIEVDENRLIELAERLCSAGVLTEL
jgi:aminopeptidase-like protein